MASSPPSSPSRKSQRPLSAVVHPRPRTSSRLSMASKNGGESRASDEDTRTAVRVAVRVRPALNPDNPGYDLIPQRFQRSMVQTTSNTSLSIDSAHGRKLFVFDRVFGPEVGQDGIWEYLSDSIHAFTQGYNVSLLAYGQSGAGKSYTMGTASPDGDPSNIGVIPRAAAALFEKLELPNKASSSSASHRVSSASNLGSLRNPRSYGQHNALGDRNWSLKATYVEIYNEQLRDLLVPEATPLGERSSVAIREDVKGNIILTGLRQVEITSVEDMLNALEFGSTIRQTDATAINAKSSRSHAVFSLNLVQRKSKSGVAVDKRLSMPLEAMTGQDASVTTDSKLHFVDLAGSERLKNTGAQGERAKEGISINGGLAALGKVISQLSSRNAGAHVSYRDSKLTRLLQDSLGGNAVTYMIACVTPAEYHLSETLNTVQYAQRARAIQSKPRIQQIEEGDKQAVIDRLKAEVAFLREQIQSASGRLDSPRRPSNGLVERNERPNERENELQNQLLDAQENYNALNQRHARLIAEMAKARDNESELQLQFGNIRDSSATDRLNRSNTFAQAVEQVVLEYEKTIQSLEQSLSSTRTTLSYTETNLLEKETKCAYIETINSQLQSRLQKLIDREASTESYLHDLEAKLDGHTSGEEKHATIVTELRKEITRIRENESSCEEYISTLEERLAEADQDAELMQREIERLEQVIERQRSLGKLDTLLYELDHIDESNTQDAEEHEGRPVEDDNLLEEEAISALQSTFHDSELHSGGDRDVTELGQQLKTVEDTLSHEKANGVLASDIAPHAELELLALRSEHETTMHELTLFHSKYEQAMQKLAELQDALNESRKLALSRDSFMPIAEPVEARPASSHSEADSAAKDEIRSTVSRSLSFELSSAIGSPVTADTSNMDMESEDGTATARPADSHDVANRTTSALTEELHRLKGLAEQREAAETELAMKYAELESKHCEALDIVEELKAEVARSRIMELPRIIRRKSSQNALAIDRANRSFVSLRSLVAESFPDKPEVVDNFEDNINAAMHELQSRAERIQELESEVSATKKEMESKTAIISGLTRERSSMKSSPVEMSMLATMRDQLERSEKQISHMRETHAAREKELTTEAENLRQSRDSFAAAVPSGGGLGYDQAIASMQSELRNWEVKHKTALESMQKTKAEMQGTIEELERQLLWYKGNADDNKSKDLINGLRNEIEVYKTLIDGNASKVAELESTHLSTRNQLLEMAKTHSAIAAEATTRHEELTSKLHQQIASHEQATKAHQEEIDLLKVNHSREISEIRLHEQSGYEQQVEVLMTEHAEAIHALEIEIGEARARLREMINQLATSLGEDVNVENLAECISRLIADQKAMRAKLGESDKTSARVNELVSLKDAILRDLEATKAAMIELLPESGTAGATLMEHFTVIKTKMNDLQGKDQKNVRMIEELEEQLQHNFDEVQVTHNRLSSLQSERQLQLDELTSARDKLQAELDGIREEHSTLQAKYHDIALNEGVKRSNSNATVRKSPSVTSLPSPPPAIPLPPLPSNASASGIPGSPTSTRPGSKDNAGSLSQVNDDQDVKLQGIQKQLYAERQLTQTLEEALEDLEKQSKKVKSDADQWKKRAQDLENEVKELKEKQAEPGQDNRWSIQAVEEERKKRQAAEAATKQLEERMHAINKSKKKKASLNCF